MINNIKKYISENKFLRTSIVLFGVVSLVVTTRLAIVEKQQASVRAFKVSIGYKDKTKKLINSEYIKNEVRKSLGYNVERIKIENLDIAEIERILANNTYIDEVEVYLDGRNILRAQILQKNPIVRVMENQSGYYLDENGDRLALSSIAAVRVPIVTGNIVPFDANYKKDETHVLNDIFTLSSEILNDEFLSALIEQIHVENKGHYVLIPKLGKEKIVLGSAEDLDEKVYKLKVFYKEGLTRVGWGKYAYLDLQDDHIVRGQELKKTKKDVRYE